MSTKSSIDRFEVQAKRHKQAALDTRHRAAEVAEKKEKKLAQKEARDRKKRDEKLRKGCREEPDDEGPKLGATNASFYPFYQQVMNRLSVEFIIRMKEENDSSLYDKYIEKVIQHVGAVDTSVQDVTVKDVVQTIKGKDCRYITGTGDSESDDDDNDDDAIGPIDVMKTFERRELTRTVHDIINSCFSHLAEAHSMMKEAFIEAGHLVHVLLKRGWPCCWKQWPPGLLWFNILQEAKVHQRIRDEIKVQENKMCTTDLKLEKQKYYMLPSWKHQVFYNSTKCVKIGKLTAAIAVYLRFALGERPRDVPLTTVGQ